MKKEEGKGAAGAEGAGLSAGPRISKATRRTLHDWDREKPTKERAARGEYVTIAAEKLDTQRKGERILVDLKQQAGGAGEMYARGSINERMFMAGKKLVQLFELSQASQLSGMPLKERVDGGGFDDGARLHGAVMARAKYVGAMSVLGKATRALVEHRVVYGRPMEEAVRLGAVVERLGDGVIRRRCELAKALVEEGLDTLADYFGMPA